MAKQNSKFFGSKIEALEDNGYVVSTEFTVETAEQALALQASLVTFATGGAAPAAAPAPAPKVEAPAPAAAKTPKPEAPAPKPAPAAAKPPKAELPPADDEDDEDEDDDGLPEELEAAETLKDIVSYYVDQNMKVNAVVKAVRALKGQHAVVDRFDDAKLDGRVKSLFEALAD